MSILPPPPPHTPPPPPSGTPRPRGRRGLWIALVVALVLVVVLAGAVVVLLTRDDDRDERDDRDRRSAEASPGDAATSGSAAPTLDPRLEDLEEARAEALEQATSALPVILSYRHDTFDADVAAGFELMTEDFAAEQQATYDGLRETVTGQQVSVRTTVARAGITGIEEDRAVVLAFLDQQATRRGKATQLTATTVTVTMVDDAGEWKVAALELEQAPALPEPDPARQTVLDAAEEVADAYLTFSHDTIDADLAAIEELLSGDLAAEFAAGRGDLRDTVIRNRTVSEGETWASGLESYGGDATATVLIAATGTVRGDSGSSPSPAIQQRRFALGMELVDGTWLAHSLEIVS